VASERGVAITGLGLVQPHGVGLASAEAVFEGRSAVAYLPEVCGIPEATGAPVRDFIPPPGAESSDRAVQFAIAAAEEAWTRSGLAEARLPRDRIATILSLSKGGLFSLARWAASPREGGMPTPPLRGHVSRERDSMPSERHAGHATRAHRGFPEETGTSEAAADWLEMAQAMPDAAARAVAARLGLAGPIGVPVTACSSGSHALAWGATLIRRGVVDVALVGAAEASLHPMILGSYRRMGVLADAGADPATSVRPFSATRRGFAIGEGAGVLVLESEASARRRGMQPIAHVAAWASGCQTTGLTEMEPTGDTLAHLIREAVGRAGVEAAAIDYVHAHGTATPANDAAEARAIRAALGDATGGVSVSSTKGAHGHLLGAAAAVELVLVALAIQRGLVPPTTNLTDPDPQIALDCTPLRPRKRTIRYALKISSGFGGQAMVVVLARP
jgi:3-oxoacyl-[acyl-carrier-protein] synthase II